MPSALPMPRECAAIVATMRPRSCNSAEPPCAGCMARCCPDASPSTPRYPFHRHTPYTLPGGFQSGSGFDEGAFVVGRSISSLSSLISDYTPHLPLLRQGRGYRGCMGGASGGNQGQGREIAPSTGEIIRGKGLTFAAKGCILVGEIEGGKRWRDMRYGRMRGDIQWPDLRLATEW